MDAWEQMLVGGPPRGLDVRDHDDPPVARLHAVPPRRPAGGREVAARRGSTSFPSYGYGAERRRRYTRLAPGAVLLERGDLAGRAPGARRGSATRAGSDASRYWLQAQMALLLAEGKPEQALELADEMPRRLPWLVNPDRRLLALLQGAGARPPRPHRRGDRRWSREELELARGVGRPGDRRAGPAGARARSTATTRSST